MAAIFIDLFLNFVFMNNKGITDGLIYFIFKKVET